MNKHSFRLFALVGLVVVAQAAADENAATDGWLPPARAGIRVIENGRGSWTVTSSAAAGFTLESAQRYKAQVGDSFEVSVRLKADLNAKALPELVCYDGEGKEIRIQSSLASGPGYFTTQWQQHRRVFPTQPGTTSVRARLRVSGRGEIGVANLEFRPKQTDPYQTGALITQPHPRTRGGVVLESNHGIVNSQLISTADRDGDGKWALIDIDLDRITKREQKGEDWRSNFEDNPNEILWSDGAVLKSDSVREDRPPDLQKSLHFRIRVHEGPYTATLSDPGRAVAVSLDGQNWKRHEAGREISLGTLAMKDGLLEFWMDACYRDPVSIGPVYFDYARLSPTLNAPSVDRLFAAARRKQGKPQRGSVEARMVSISVSAPSFVEGANWPVRCGLPLPQGELLSAEHAAVLNAEGAKIPSQCRAMAAWPDGSIQWLYLDFMHDFSKGGDGHYSVVYGNQVDSMPSPGGVRIQPAADGWEVDTGAIRFLVSKSRFGMMENVRLASGQTVQREPIAAEIVEATGKTWSALALPVEKIEIEQAGPLHAVIRVETKLAESGKPSNGFYHRARIHAYAGSPLVQLDYFIANTDSRPAKEVGGSMSSKVVVKSVALKLKPAQPITGAAHESGLTSLPGALVQKSEESALIRSATDAHEVRQHLRGWVALGLAGGGSLGAGVEGFREQFPKAICWKPDELELALWAEEGGDYDWIEGVGKTHHVSLFYGVGRPASAELLANGPVLAVATPQWYAQSGAFGPQVAASQSGLPAVEETLASHMKDPVIEKVGLGFENYGDHSSGGYVKGTFLWDNNEYDLPAGCLAHFARTGDREALRLGLASALHYLDVDTIHYSSAHDDWPRAQHVHSHGLFGHHTAQGPDFHHAGYVQGLIWYSYFTGEPIGILGAQGIADWVLRKADVQTGAMERALGHPLMTLNDVYEATGEEQYLLGSARLVDQALKWEHPERSGFLAPITESPAYYSGSPFCGGILPSALMKFNSWAQLPEIDAMLQRVAQWTLTDVWRPPAGIQSKGGSPRRKGEAQHIASHARLMALEFARTKDPFFLVVPWNSMVEGFGKEGKPFGTRTTGLVFNYLPWLLSAVRDNGNPEPERMLEVSAKANPVILAKGEKTLICFTLKNSGNTTVEDLRASFHSRLDFKIAAAKPAPDKLLPGQVAECCYELQAPERINLTSDYNRIAYGHWSALYQRAGRPRLAHRSIEIELKHL